MLRTDVRARYEAFDAGLRRCGFDVGLKPGEPREGDVLVIWNRHRFAQEATRYERVGAKVIVAENGWLNRSPGNGKMIALCLGHHNGAGQWSDGPEDRWAPLGIELRPWREDGDHILVLGQRGIGEHGVAQPRRWAEDTVARLRAKTKRPVILRLHPGNAEPPPEPDWSNVWAAVTWASGAGIKAIVAGVPVFHGLPTWIGAGAARHGFDNIEKPYLGDRLPMLRRLAWAQWSLDEITTGEPVARLLAV